MPNNEHILKRRMEREFRRGISPAAWRWAIDEGYVWEALDPAYGPPGEDGLRGFLGRLLQVQDEGLGSRIAKKPLNIPSADPDLAARIEAVSRLAANHAAGDSEILRFRQSVLHRDTPMSAKEAEAFLDDPEARQPSRAGARTLEAPAILSYQNRLSSQDIHVWPGSPLDRLRGLSISLSETYPWQPAQAAAFVLEALVPLATPLMLRMPQSAHEYRPRRAKITLEIDMWMPVDEVLRAYRHVQRQVLRGHNRPISRRSIDLVNFVLQRPSGTWQQVLDEWNNEHPTSSYSDYRHLRYAFVRAQQALLAPSYRYWMGD
jgi:hypothetical protein